MGDSTSFNPRPKNRLTPMGSVPVQMVRLYENAGRQPALAMNFRPASSVSSRCRLSNSDAVDAYPATAAKSRYADPPAT